MRHHPKAALTTLTLPAFTFLGGCATIAHGSHENVSIKSEPSQAAVYVDGKKNGQTPEKVSMSRGKDHKVRIVKTGYYPFRTEVRKSSSGLTYLDGLPALGVDHLTGAAYNLVPNKIDAHLNLKPKSNTGEPINKAAANTEPNTPMPNPSHTVPSPAVSSTARASHQSDNQPKSATSSPAHATDNQADPSNFSTH